MELPDCILVDPTACPMLSDSCEGSWTIDSTPDESNTALGAVPRLRRAPIALCPDCAVPSRRIHSRYRRKLADGPWANIPVLIEVQLRHMVDEEARHQVEADRRLFPIRMSYLRLLELLDSLESDRKFAWQRKDGSNVLTCDAPPNSAKIMLLESSMFWVAVVERTGTGHRSTQKFATLKPALDWAEAEMDPLIGN